MATETTFLSDNFFEEQERRGLALSYDDVLLKSGYSETMPTAVDTGTRFSRNITLHIPIVSAAMDTVTESGTAIALALLGGIGVIHKNLDIKTQASEVARVKHFLHGVINSPVTVAPTDTVKKVLGMRKSRQLPFHSFPVVDGKGKLVGFVGRADFDFCDDEGIRIKGIMNTKLLTVSATTDVRSAHTLMIKNKRKSLPLVDKAGKLVGLYTFKDTSRIVREDQSRHTLDDNNQLRVAAAVGTGTDTLKRVTALVKEGVDAVVVDTAHGDSAPVYKTIKVLKKKFPKLDIVAGNVSDGDSARRLADVGVDGIKVGQGPGSICTTRVVAGIGAPQVSAVADCARAVRDMDVPVCADGGITQTGHITIALGAGASTVMLGSLLAGTDEAPGEIVHHNGRQWKLYRGMGSLGAMMESAASRNRYGQDSASVDKLVPEGIEGMTPYKGPLEVVVHQYVGGLRGGMGYVGAKNVSELHHKARFHRITTAGKSESHPHDVVITKEAPNYSPKN